MISVRYTRFALLYLRMLFDLIESTSMHLIQLLFDILDYWCLLVERSTRDNKCLCTSELRYYTSQLTSRTYTWPLVPCLLFVINDTDRFHRSSTSWVKLDTCPWPGYRC